MPQSALASRLIARQRPQSRKALRHLYPRPSRSSSQAATQRNLIAAAIDPQSARHGTAEERFEAFAGVIEDTFVPLVLTVGEIGSFHGHARVAGLGAMYLTEIAVGSGIVMNRTHKTIKRKAPEYLKVNLQLRGRSMISQDGKQATLSPGDFVIYDTTRPFRFASEDAFHMYGVVIPMELLRLPDSRLTELTARRFSGRLGMGALVSQFLGQLGNQLAAGRHTDNIHLADAILDLLKASLTEQSFGHNAVGSNSGRNELRTRIRVFIESRLDDPQLNIATIAAAHHISVRHLQKLFEEVDQTVTGWIRVRRIEHCRKDLSNVELADVAVGDICRRWGFVDAAHFSKAFKAVHGLAPRDYRAQALSAQR